MDKIRAGIVGATGMVGQRFVTLLDHHPWFQVTAVCASPASAGKKYRDAVEGKWRMETPIPDEIGNLTVLDAADIEAVRQKVDFVFCAVNLGKEETRLLEESYARAEIPVVSNNSACRMLPDVPMIIPEINPDHLNIIPAQRRRLGTQYGFIAVKPNCSIQSYVPALTPLLQFRPTVVSVCTYQAISGAGKTFDTFPEIMGNVIPYISGEEEKSEKEPLKVWGNLSENQGEICLSDFPVISAQCLRVPVLDGHMAAVSVRFETKPSREDILSLWFNFETVPQQLELPSAPRPLIQYLDDPARPQPVLDRNFANGMGISIGRLREDPLWDYKFVCLSHNTVRGAAGGAILTAELLRRKGYLLSQEEKK